MTLRAITRQPVSAFFFPSHERDKEMGQDYESFFARLAELKISLFFVGDNRSVRSANVVGSTSDADEDDELEHDDDEIVHVSHSIVSYRNIRAHHGKTRSQNDALNAAVHRLSRSFTQQAMSGAARGFSSINEIYTDVVKGIASYPGSSAANVQDLRDSLSREASRSVQYAEFGLTAPLQATPMLDALSNAEDERRDLITRVLRPYVEGLAARHDAIRSVYEGILAFKDTLESFFLGKKVQFSMRQGFTVLSVAGEELPFTSLSSGEKQLLLLLANVLTMQESQTILLIDEPELSLNIKWQRRLVDTLLRFDRGGQVQFVLASHSIELLTLHESNVATLATS